MTIRSFFRYFPWRLFWKMFWTLWAVLIVLILLTMAIQGQFDATGFFSFLGLSLVASFLFSYRFVLPLRQVILKALRISSKKYVNEFEEEDVLVDEEGEYGELERVLDKIRQKLKRRRLQLSHEREESQALIGSMDDAIVSVNLEERIVFFNARFAAQFLSREANLKSEGQLTPILRCFRQPEVLDLFDRALRKGETQTRQVRMGTLQSLQPLYFSLRVSPLREEKTREVYGALAVFHDITEIKRAEQIRIEFVENASHELRTPLTSIKGFVETLKLDVQEGKMDQAPQFLSIISKSVDRLTELVSDMLTISSLESNSPLKIEKINPRVVSEEVISRLSKLASAKRIMIKARFDVNELSADEGKLEQVISNLVENAIKYIPEGGTIDVIWSQESLEEIRLTVKDNGPGIAPEHQKRLFERFYRVDKGRAREVGGTGLGLAIVKHIVQSHGGSVQVQSEQGQGADFICSFPSKSS